MSAADSGEKGPVFFDSNIVVYALSASFTAEDAQKKAIARRIILDAAAKRRAVISAQVLGESFVTLVKKGTPPLLPSEAANTLRGIARQKVVPLTGDLVFRAVDIQREFQLSYWDALIIAAAESAGCAIVWSEDLLDGQQYGAVTVRNPFARG